MRHVAVALVLLLAIGLAARAAPAPPGGADVSDALERLTSKLAATTAELAGLVGSLEEVRGRLARLVSQQAATVELSRGLRREVGEIDRAPADAWEIQAEEHRRVVAARELRAHLDGHLLAVLRRIESLARAPAPGPPGLLAALRQEEQELRDEAGRLDLLIAEAAPRLTAQAARIDAMTRERERLVEELGAARRTIEEIDIGVERLLAEREDLTARFRAAAAARRRLEAERDALSAEPGATTGRR